MVLFRVAEVYSSCCECSLHWWRLTTIFSCLFFPLAMLNTPPSKKKAPNDKRKPPQGPEQLFCPSNAVFSDHPQHDEDVNPPTCDKMQKDGCAVVSKQAHCVSLTGFYPCSCTVAAVCSSVQRCKLPACSNTITS